MNIKVNDRVKVVSGSMDGCTGKVIRIHDFIVPVAIVEFDGCTAKIQVKDLEKVEPQENQEAKNGIPEGAKRITKDEYRDALQKITSPEAIFSGGSADPTHALIEGLSAIVFGRKVEKILFKDKDAVILTEDDLVGVLWNACDPVAMVKEVNLKQSALGALLMSVSSVIVLRDLVTILFGVSEND